MYRDKVFLIMSTSIILLSLLGNMVTLAGNIGSQIQLEDHDDDKHEDHDDDEHDDEDHDDDHEDEDDEHEDHHDRDHDDDD